LRLSLNESAVEGVSPVKNHLRAHIRKIPERPMSRTFALILAASLLVPLAACGRKAPLDPPSAAPPVNGEKAPPAAPAQDKPFILDGLIR
jgi:predicted small lipoprotein YifL